MNKLRTFVSSSLPVADASAIDRVPDSDAPHRTATAFGTLIRWDPPAGATNPFFGPVLHGIRKACTELDISVALEVVPPGASAPLPQLVQRGQVNGLIVVSVQEPDFLDRLLNTGLACVLVDNVLERSKLDRVHGDDEQAGYLAICHLIERGHRDPIPAMITGPGTVTSVVARMAGYRRALEEHGLRFDPAYIVDVVRLYPNAGRTAMQTLLDLPVPPTAVFCCADAVALGAMAAVSDRGLVVGEHCSIIGHDDIEAARYSHPPLSTVRLDKELLGAQAVRHLFERLHHPTMPGRDTRIGVDLIQRGTVGPRQQTPPTY